MSLIAVQSAAGRHVLRTDPDEAEHALRAIETTSRDALAETRHMLCVLRQDGLESPLGLSDLAGLVAEVNAAGLATDVVVDGDRLAAVPSAVDVSAYRIVQEALTNAVKYAGPARATVRVCWGANEVTVEVCDDGRGAAAERHPDDVAGGHGLAGMRERVTLLGGDLSAGPRPGGGFRVIAHLPFAKPATGG
jgi:signal transduction histidine kinase